MIVVAMFVQSAWTGTCGLLGLLCSTTAAVALSLDAGTIRSGLFGYNGYLVGLAMGTFHPVAWAWRLWPAIGVIAPSPQCSPRYLVETPKAPNNGLGELTSPCIAPPRP